MGNAGTVELEGRIDRRGYCSGKKIALSCKYWNIHYINYLFKLKIDTTCILKNVDI